MRRKTAIFDLAIVLLLAAVPVQAGGWKWIAYGDTRTNDADHRTVLSAIKANTPDYKFMINVGDVVEAGSNKALWDIWQNSCNEILGGTGQSNVPPSYMAALGNHDEPGIYEGLNNWKTYLSGQAQFGNDGKFFTFDYQDARFIVLNTEESYTGPQRTLLQEAIRTNPKKWLFAIWHKPIFDFGVKAYEPDIHQQWGIPLYQNGCDMIFMGHAHYYVRSQKLQMLGGMNPPLDSLRGTVQVVTGNGGAPHAAADEGHDGNGYMVAYSYDQNTAPFYGYTELNVDGDTLRLRHFSAAGQVMDQAVYTANLKPNLVPRYALQLAWTDGGGWIEAYPYDTLYYAGTEVRLTARSTLGWRFTGWEGGGLTGTANPVYVTMDSARHVTAHFEKLPAGQFELRTNPAPLGSIELTPPGPYYARGAQVSARAVPPPGWLLTRWDDAASGTQETVTVIVDTNKILTAHFHQMAVNALRLRTYGAGQILASPAGGEFPETTNVRLTAQPAQGWQFLEWTGGANGTANPVTVTMGHLQEVKARFSRTGARIVKIAPSQDGYVRGSLYASANYGADTVLRVLEGGSDLYRYRSYLMFPLREVSGTVQSAVLRLHANRSGFPDGAPARVMAFGAAGAWTEAGLTWKNVPAQGALLDSTIGMGSAGNVYSWDVTGLVLQKLTGDTALTVLLKDQPGTNRAVLFDVRESAFSPLLEVEVDDPNAVGDAGERGVPRESRLEQNYPNPFNPSTAIRYQLEAPGLVRLEVFDLLGRQVATLASGVQSAGYYSVVWNAGQCASGTYYCRLQALPVSGGEGRPFYAARTMILMR